MISLLIITIAILFTGIFSGLEIGSYTLNKIRLKYQASRNNSRALLLKENIKDPQIFIFTTIICQNFFVYIASSLVTNLYIKHGIAGVDITMIYNVIPWSAEIAATLTLLLPMFIFAEFGPKNLFMIKADSLMYSTVRLQQVCIILCKPITITLKFLSNIIPSSNLIDFDQTFQNITNQRLKLFFTTSSQEGTISTHQNKMINNTMDLNNFMVTKIMIPLKKLLIAPENITPKECLSLLKNHTYNNIPLFAEKRNSIIGTVHFFDVLSAVGGSENNLQNYLTPVANVKWDMNVQETFCTLQEKRQNMALVTGKHHKTVGIIYLKDIVKYITETL